VNIKRAFLGIAIACTVVGATLMGATPAQADYYESWQNYNTKGCIDDSFQYGLRSFSCNYSHYQHWRLLGAGGQLQNVATGRCMDDSFQYGLRSFPCNNLNYQNWTIASNVGVGIVWRNDNTGRCIDDSIWYGLRSFPCNYSDYQRWN
jgi:hypothetical protein